MQIIKIGIVGEFQAGKSTLINCLLKRQIASVGDGTSTTHTIVNYKYSSVERIEYTNNSGDLITKDVSELDFLDVNFNIKEIDVYVNIPILKDFILVDMPGFGYNNADDKAAEYAMSQIDFAIAVMTNYRAIGGEESKFLLTIQQLKRHNVQYYLCLNCTDEKKWTPSNKLNTEILKESMEHLSQYMPLSIPDDVDVPIVNFMWFWYSQYKDDPIFQNYQNLLYRYNLLNENITLKDIEKASNFHFIESIFSKENRAYLSLKKEFKEDLFRLKDEISPIGTIQTFAFNNIPKNWLMCDGSEIKIIDFPELFNAIRFTFGGDGKEYFNLPDLRGRFVRGWSKDSAIDKDRKFGSYQEDAIQEHSHELNKSSNSTEEDGLHRHQFYAESVDVNGWGNTSVKQYIYDTNYSNTSTYNVTCHNGHSHKLPQISVGNIKEGKNSVETRPTNIALCYCIKAINYGYAGINFEPQIIENEEIYKDDEAIKNNTTSLASSSESNLTLDSEVPLNPELSFHDIIGRLEKKFLNK